MSNDAVSQLQVIPPSQLGGIIHLYLDGYQPGKKARSPHYARPMCGVFTHSYQFAERVPIQDALDWTDHRITYPDGLQGAHWQWCRACIGHAAHTANLTADLVKRLAAETSEEAAECALRDKIAAVLLAEFGPPEDQAVWDGNCSDMLNRVLEIVRDVQGQIVTPVEGNS